MVETLCNAKHNLKKHHRMIRKLGNARSSMNRATRILNRSGSSDG
jgi:hypothetical protein